MAKPGLDPNQNHKFTPFIHPTEVPPIASILEGNQICLSFSDEMVPPLLGALELLMTDNVFEGDLADRKRGVSLFKQLRDLLMAGNCVPCDDTGQCLSFYPNSGSYEFSPGAVNGVGEPPAGYLQHPWKSGDTLTFPGISFLPTDTICTIDTVAGVG